MSPSRSSALSCRFRCVGGQGNGTQLFVGHLELYL